MTFEPLGKHRLYCGDSSIALPELDAESIDAVVSDPPSGIGFMGRDWDRDKGGRRIENAGWEIRDCIDHIFYSGFPKSLDVSKAIDRAAGAERFACPYCRDTGEAWDPLSGEGPTCPACKGQAPTKTLPAFAKGRGHGKDQNGRPVYRGINGGHVGTVTTKLTTPATAEAKRYQGWGTALKPAHECWWLARKPLIGTVAANVLEHGTGALNVDGCRFRYGDPCWPGPQEIGDPNRFQGCDGGSFVVDLDKYPTIAGHTLGRWPANIYYSPKPSTSEREAGCEGLTQHSAGDLTGGRVEGSDGLQSPRAGAGRTSSGRGNTHPTVKAIGLMRWLCRLITPTGGTVLDPFAGSGTTILACEAEGFACTAVELDPKHCDIIRARHAAATAQMRLAL